MLRPLLELRRATLAEMVAACGRLPVHDPTNDLLDRSRNRIRHALLPRLRAGALPDADRTLLDLARRARTLTDCVERVADALLPRCAARTAPWRIEIDTSILDRAGDTVIAEILRRTHLALRDTPGRWSWVEGALAMLGSAAGARHEGPRNLLVERARDRLLIIDRDAAGVPLVEPQPLIAGAAAVTPGGSAFGVTLAEGASPDSLRIDASAARGGLAVRSPRRGEHFWPFGADRPRRLGGFLARRRVPRFDRDRLPVVVDADDHIVCVPGIEIAHPARVRGDAFVSISRVSSACAFGPGPG